MLGKRVQLIKQSQVEVKGKASVPAESGSSGGSAAVRAPAAAVCGVPQQARIVESNNEYAVIEISCSCGAKSHIQCNYAHIHEGS